MSRLRPFLPLLLLIGCTLQEPQIRSGDGALRVIPPVEPLDALTLRVSMGVIGGTGTTVWSTSDDRVATVDSAGNLSTVGNGEVTISAERGGMTGFAKLTVRQRATSLTVTPSAVKLAGIGEKVALQIVARDRKDQPVAADALTFVSGSENVAIASSDGSITAIGVGQTSILVQSGDASQPVTVDVTAGTGQADVRVDPR